MAEGVWTQGRVAVGDASNAMGTFPSTDNFKWASSGTAAGTTGLVISAKPGRFYRGVYENGAATAYYLQIFDKATAPIAGDVPVYEKRLAVSGEVEIDLTNVNGKPCLAGIAIAMSTTPGVLTLAIAQDLAFRSTCFTSNT